MTTALIVAGAVLSGILYRMGGSAAYPKIWRRLGCSLVTNGLLVHMFGFDWLVFVLGTAILYGALTTYHDYLQPNGEDNFYVTGLVYGVALLPWLWMDGSIWTALLLRSVVLAIATGLWSYSQWEVVKEEFGRGFLLVISLLFLT